MAQDKWPFPPQILDTVLLGSTSTTSTTGADLYGTGTSKPMGLGPGLIIITSHLLAFHSANNQRIDFRMQVSQDGASWVDADPGGGFPWYNNLTEDKVIKSFDITFAFAKTQHAQQYAKVQWKTPSGTASLAAFAADGWASAFRMFKFPTWTAL